MIHIRFAIALAGFVVFTFFFAHPQSWLTYQGNTYMGFLTALVVVSFFHLIQPAHMRYFGRSFIYSGLFLFLANDWSRHLDWSAVTLARQALANATHTSFLFPFIMASAIFARFWYTDPRQPDSIW